MSWYAASTPQRLGDWTFELREDELADLTFRGQPVLRSIRAVVRDRNWDTAPTMVDTVSRSAMTLAIGLETRGLGADLRGTIRVGADDAHITISLEMESASEFWTNRIGLVVLHPPDLAGTALVVRHPDGSQEQTAFPVAISPHQPVRAIAELAWTTRSVDVAVRFTGDVFEMEDQRNWTDASYKTYSRPLGLPFPYRIDAGGRIRQVVEVAARLIGSPQAIPDPDVVVLHSGCPFPEIAVGAATAPDPAPTIDPIGAALLVELDLASSNWPAALHRAAAAGLPLDVRFTLTDDDRATLRAAVQLVSNLPVVRVAAFQQSGPAADVSDAAATTALRDSLREVGMTTAVVGGARSHFTEINRERHRLASDLDGIVFSITPLFHSTDTNQLIESLTMQRLVAEQAVEQAGGTPVHIGPITLRPRFNNVATTPPPRPSRIDLADGYGPDLLDAGDERQDADELAAWTVASAAALAVPGVASLTFFEEWGPRGIRTSDGADRPVAGAVRALAELRGELLSGASPDGLVWAIGATPAEAGRSAVLVANLDRHARTVEVRHDQDSWSVPLAPGRWARLMM